MQKNLIKSDTGCHKFL